MNTVQCKDCVHAHAGGSRLKGLPRMRWCVVLHRVRALSVPRECDHFEHPLTPDAVARVAADIRQLDIWLAPGSATTLPAR